jgi:hypothetical protein
MDIKAVDVRNQQWEALNPTFLVIFWRQLAEQQKVSGWASEEWELTNGDAEDVSRWTADNRGSRAASIWLVVHDSRGRGHVRLSGSDPKLARPE